jgi:hypothetical protein
VGKGCGIPKHGAVPGRGREEEKKETDEERFSKEQFDMLRPREANGKNQDRFKEQKRLKKIAKTAWLRT